LELERIERVEKGKAAMRRGEITTVEASIKEAQYNKKASHLWKKRWVVGMKGRRTA